MNRCVALPLGKFFHTVKKKKHTLRTIHLGFSSLEKSSNYSCISLWCLLTFPSVLSFRLCAVSAVPKLLPGLVWDHERVAASGFSWPLQGPECQHKRLQQFCKSWKQIQSVHGPGAGGQFQYFYRLQLHTEKEGPLATGQEGRYQSWWESEATSPFKFLQQLRK